MGHAIHFLERVAGRGSAPEMELALALYRDPVLVKELLLQEAPPGAGRVAFALERTGGPFIVAERDGSFVTMLGASMKHDLPIIARARIDHYTRTIERIRTRLALANEEYEKSGEWPHARLVTRGHLVTREEFVAATAWNALASHEDVSSIHRTSERIGAVRKGPARRWTKPRAEHRAAMEAVWNQIWYLGHSAARLASDGVLPFFETLPPTWPSILTWAPIRQGLLGPAMRGVWAGGRIGKPALTWLKTLPVGSENTAACVCLTLLAIAGAHGKLEAEALKHFERVLSDAPDFMAKEVAILNIGPSLLRVGPEIFEPMVQKMAFEALSLWKPGHPLLPARAEELPVDIAVATLASAPVPLIPELHIAVTLVPFIARRPAADLYLPREWSEAFFAPWEPGDTVALAQAWDEYEGRPQPAKAAHTLGRNDPCHCGSGKKLKRCHGA